MNRSRDCLIAGCARGGQLARGLCLPHYNQMRRLGRLDEFPKATPAQRLAEWLVVMPDGCIEWTRGRNEDGYGQICVWGKGIGTHRLAWILANGPIPDGLEVCHRCDNPPCCNVEHLFLGTHIENIADRDAKGRCRAGQINNYNASKKCCKRGHEFSAANTRIVPKPDGQPTRMCIICERLRGAAKRRKMSVSALLDEQLS